MKQAVLLSLAITMSLTCYGAPTFDGGSGAAASASIDAMKADMTKAEQKRLDAAFQIVHTYVSYLMIQATLMGERKPAEARILWMALGQRTASGVQDLADLICHRMTHPDNFVTDIWCDRFQEGPADAPQGSYLDAERNELMAYEAADAATEGIGP